MLNYIIYFLSIFIVLEIILLIIPDENVIILLKDEHQESHLSMPRNNYNTLLYEENENDYYIDSNLGDYEILPIFDLEEMKACYYLLIEFRSCFDIESKREKECLKLVQDKGNDFEKCELIYSHFSFSEHDNELEDLINQAKNYDEEIFEMIKSYEKENEDEFEEMNNKKKAIFDEIINEGSFLKNDKDCIEYELSEIDNRFIKCAKYE